MDYKKIGQLIRSLRRERRLTQLQLAERLSVSPKTVSKWECGLGCPDISLLNALGSALGVPAEAILRGDLPKSSPVSGNLSKTLFYVCPFCSGIVTATTPMQLSCCGKLLTPLSPQKAAPEDRLTVEPVEDEWFITTDHPMRKDCYISFLAFVTGDSMQLIKQYPEWELQARLPRRRHGTLYYYSTAKGLFYQYL